MDLAFEYNLLSLLAFLSASVIFGWGSFSLLIDFEILDFLRFDFIDFLDSFPWDLLVCLPIDLVEARGFGRSDFLS